MPRGPRESGKRIRSRKEMDRQRDGDILRRDSSSVKFSDISLFLVCARRVDVPKVPKWVRHHVEEPLVECEVIPENFVNSSGEASPRFCLTKEE